MKDQIQKVKMSQIVADPDQPRQEFDQKALADLVSSIKKQGIMVPLAVEEMPNGRYLIIDGERRWRASGTVGLKEVPVIVYPAMDDKDRIMTRFHIQEQHSNWTAFDKARAIAILQEANGLSTQDVADLLGLSSVTVSSYLSLLKLSKRSLSTANKSKIPFSYLHQITKIMNRVPELNLRRRLEEVLVNKCKNGEILTGEDLSKYGRAVAVGGEKVAQKIVHEPEFNAEKALEFVGEKSRLENKRIHSMCLLLAKLLKRVKTEKKTDEMGLEEAAALEKLKDAIEEILLEIRV